MTTGKVTIQNDTGLHARPGNEFVTFIKTLQNCKIEIENEAGKRVNASSLLKVLSLGVKKDSVLTIYCDGENEQENLKKIEEFLANLKD
ncbi:HPr family phosphocarrier protein [Brachyspira innocens]|uniref:Phosphocarrier protein HPr n=3 Tax=Brachyspira TaxID=29521 RepID=D5U8U4_BRAM5|nr:MULTISPECIES: HPr family phosphocarrier protein [Brachyspira]ADG71117.1 Phosphotransferase system, phosphocarrier protein HPr [Brachyspira murdochii DSM 12563]MDO6994446.1 HPr family phosphocarrier protein [Brachyspira innocens]MDO7020263.1 HPr family phosphocarrier protein [Brachyspira innocens]PCG20154.1 phosphocarrier protein HPr [Brachyspira sp. G79]PPS22879.1 phosphocarrier protein HPr [Brachyspira murdochii]